MKKMVYLCDLCPPDDNGNQPEVEGSMHDIEISTQSQGQTMSVHLDACQACKEKFFPIRG